MSGARTFSWARVALSEREMATMRAVRWKVFSLDEAVAIAEGWNAGIDTAVMAAEGGWRPGSLRILIGKLTQMGVAMRPATRKPRQSTRARQRAALAREILGDLSRFPRGATMAELTDWLGENPADVSAAVHALFEVGEVRVLPGGQT